jgi:squalene-hopene/tetraprenyl-beta-curcumene cyclase
MDSGSPGYNALGSSGISRRATPGAAAPQVDAAKRMAASNSRVSDPDLAAVEAVIASASHNLKQLQNTDGEWSFELEADATIPSEFILLEHFLGRWDAEEHALIANYLRAIQAEHGGWPLFYQGDFDMSASVKAYYALKLCGDDPNAPHMARARAAILARGGAARTNVFTRFTLALFGQVPWRAVPVMPVEIMLLPKWAPFHLDKVSYWSRTVIVPLLVLAALKPQARNPGGVGIAELFVVPPEREQDYLVNPTGSVWAKALLALDKALKVCEPHFPNDSRKRAIEKALEFILPRLNGEDGLGSIYPAMANAVMVFETLGYPEDDPHRAIAMRAIRKHLVFDKAKGMGYCQPCLSPVWDTSLAMHALLEAGEAPGSKSMDGAVDWLLERQILDVVGDWAQKRPGLRPGGWAFQYRNDYYPDLDDTSVVGLALHRLRQVTGDPRLDPAIARAAEWVIGMQSKNGGWGSFDADNTHAYLNHIPFADHGALLDPPTADLTARCLSFLGQIGYDRNHPAVAAGIEFLLRDQEPDGSWFGRWGTNYVYGTWSVLCAFNALGESPAAPHIRRAVAWLKAFQQPDGGWGEDGRTYWTDRKGLAKESTASQTAWAVLALMAAGEVDSDAVKRGIAFLLNAPRDGANWQEPWFTAVGFPRVFYLRYHGYSAYFPLWALARYRNLVRSNARTTPYGM